MNFGGPVWHASVAPQSGHIVLQPTLHARAVKALAGVGDQDHEWHEWSGFAYHIRRRLTAAEAARAGEVRDIRGTEEAEARYTRMAPLLPAMARLLAREELRLPGEPSAGATPGRRRP
jgi:hypothetical protein